MYLKGTCGSKFSFSVHSLGFFGGAISSIAYNYSSITIPKVLMGSLLGEGIVSAVAKLFSATQYLKNLSSEQFKEDFNIFQHSFYNKNEIPLVKYSILFGISSIIELMVILDEGSLMEHLEVGMMFFTLLGGYDIFIDRLTKLLEKISAFEEDLPYFNLEVPSKDADELSSLFDHHEGEAPNERTSLLSIQYPSYLSV